MPITEVYLAINKIPDKETFAKHFPRDFLYRELPIHTEKEKEVFFCSGGIRYISHKISSWKLWDFEFLFLVAWESDELNAKAKDVTNGNISIHEYLCVAEKIYEKELEKKNIEKQEKFLKFTAMIPLSIKYFDKFEIFNRVMGNVCGLQKRKLFDNTRILFSEKWLL